MSDEVFWWCEFDRRIVDLDDVNGPSCSPELQCTGGRRRSLPCGWYRLVPDDLAAIRYELRRHRDAQSGPMSDVTVDGLVELLAPLVDTPTAVAVYVTRAFNAELGRRLGFELPDGWGRWVVSGTTFPAHATLFGVPVVVNDAMASVGGRSYEVRWRRAPMRVRDSYEIGRVVGGDLGGSGDS